MDRESQHTSRDNDIPVVPASRLFLAHPYYPIWIQPSGSQLIGLTGLHPCMYSLNVQCLLDILTEYSPPPSKSTPRRAHFRQVRQRASDSIHVFRASLPFVSETVAGTRTTQPTSCTLAPACRYSDHPSFIITHILSNWANGIASACILLFPSPPYGRLQYIHLLDFDVVPANPRIRN
jgi:hypothetical protein